MNVTRAGRYLAGLVGTAVLSGCSSPDLFETAELITVTETSTRLVPTSTVITSVVNPMTMILGDGVYEVGEDVAAGRYTTSGPRVPGGICVWSWLPYEDAPVEKAISGGFTEGPGQLTVSLGDILQTRGGCDWRLTS